MLQFNIIFLLDSCGLEVLYVVFSVCCDIYFLYYPQYVVFNKNTNIYTQFMTPWHNFHLFLHYNFASPLLFEIGSNKV